MKWRMEMINDNDIKELLNNKFLKTLYENNLSIYVTKTLREQSSYIDNLATLKEPVLIIGDTGTGKESIARAIHEISLRQGKVFKPVNCGGINDDTLLSELFGHKKGSFTNAINDKKGVVAIANGGTIFLDEIGDISPKAQVALLRFLDGNGEYNRLGDLGMPQKSDVRIICATNKDLKKEIKKGNYREDFYYRIATFIVKVPPLDPFKTPMDEFSINWFLRNIIKEFGWVKSITDNNYNYPKISPSALWVLNNYNYPGNFRELKSILKQAFIKSNRKIIKKEDLPPYEIIIKDISDSDNSKNDFLSLPADQFKSAINKLIFEKLNLEKKEKGSVRSAAISFGMDNGKFNRKLNDARNGKIL